MIIRDIEHAESILQSYVANVAKFSGDNMSLDRMWPLLDIVGNPQKKLRVVHVAGTSGKTSSAYFIAALLGSSGKTTGLTVSPHIDSITERVQINGSPVSDEDFCSMLGEFIEIVQSAGMQPSYFELMIVFVYWVFDKKGVDYAVIETGMGGLLDGTNVARNANKVCVITDIGIDHTHILGNSIREIATQKAGIIHEKNQVFMYQQSSEIDNVFQSKADEVGAKLEFVKPSKESQFAKNLQILPLFQLRNFNLALHACRYIAKRDRFDLQIIDPGTVIIPGRMELVAQKNGSLIVLDGAHNAQKVEVFVDSFTKLFPNKTTTTMLALKKGKEYEEVIDILSEITDEFVLTSFSNSQDLPSKPVDPEVLGAYCLAKGYRFSVVVEPTEAVEKLKLAGGDVGLVIGSFYLIGQIRKNL